MKMEIEKFKVNISLNNMNKLTVECTGSAECADNKYAFYIYNGKKVIDKIPYSSQNKTIYWLSERGKYRVKVFIKNKGEKVSIFSSDVEFDGIKPIYCNGQNLSSKNRTIKNIYTVLKEIITNRMRMIRLSMYDYTLINKDSYLGKLWSVLNPLIQIGTYWFVFGIGIRNNHPINGYPFLPWMLCGLIPWFFISYSITHGASSIHSKANTALKLQYPVYTIPMGSILVGFYNHIVTLAILTIMLIAFKFYPNIYWFNLIYYFIFEFVFLTSLAMITSVLTMIARDFKKLINSLIRLLFYITPILWNTDKLPRIVQDVLKANPILYIVNGFRDSLLYNKSFYEHPKQILFFWVINICLFVIGCNLQVKFRNRFIDML